MPKLNTGASTFYTNSIASLTDGDYYEMRENGGVCVQIAGTWVGTISFQQSNDEVNWVSVAALAAPGTGGANVTNTTGNGMFFMVVQGRFFRAVFTAYTSGTAVVGVRFVSDGSINYSFSGSSATGANADQIQGSAASGATDSGNPLKIGGSFNTTLPTVATGQRVDAQFDNRGCFIPSATGNNTLYWSYAAAASGIVNTTTAVTIKAAAGASVRNYLKTLTIETDTLGAATELVVRDGAAGTVLWRGKLQTATQAGRTISFDPPLRGTPNTLMEVATLTATVTGGVYVNASGYTGA